MKYDLSNPIDRFLCSHAAATGQLESEPPKAVLPENGTYVRQLEPRAGFRKVGYCWPSHDGGFEGSADSW